MLQRTWSKGTGLARAEPELSVPGSVEFGFPRTNIVNSLSPGMPRPASFSGSHQPFPRLLYVATDSGLIWLGLTPTCSPLLSWPWTFILSLDVSPCHEVILSSVQLHMSAPNLLPDPWRPSPERFGKVISCHLLPESTWSESKNHFG